MPAASLWLSPYTWRATNRRKHPDPAFPCWRDRHRPRGNPVKWWCRRAGHA